MNDLYQTQQYWNDMKKTELKEIIRKEVREALDPEFEKAQDKLYTSVTGKTPGSQGLNKFRKDKYVVSYTFYYKDDYDYDYVENIEASSPEEAIDIVQKNRREYNIPRTAKNFKATKQK